MQNGVQTSGLGIIERVDFIAMLLASSGEISDVLVRWLVGCVFRSAELPLIRGEFKLLFSSTFSIIPDFPRHDSLPQVLFWLWERLLASGRFGPTDFHQCNVHLVSNNTPWELQKCTTV